MSSFTRNGRPLARASGLITERVGGELVVYDGETHEAHCLKPLATAVFDASDNSTSSADVARLASDALGRPVTNSDVDAALDELEACGLLVSPGTDGISRRSLMKRGAAVGGVAFAATLVTSVVAPAVGMAASTTPMYPCGFSGMAIAISAACTNPTTSVTTTTIYSAKWTSPKDSSRTTILSGEPTSSNSWGVIGPRSNTGGCELNNQPTNTSEPTWSAQVTAQLSGTDLFITVPTAANGCTYSISEVATWSGNTGCIHNVPVETTSTSDIYEVANYGSSSWPC